VLKRALLHATGPLLLPEFLPSEINLTACPPSRRHDDPGSAELDAFVDQRLEAGSEDLYAECLAYMERLLLTRVLRHANGNQSRAAAILGITRGSLRNKIRALGITINQAVNVGDDEEPASLSSVG